jgi:NADPH-dependent curcumin reductase CurA
VAINYKTAPSLSKAISEACGTNTKKNTKTKGVDLVFDNVGSRFLEAALSNLAMGARVVLCGAISQYNASAASGKGFTGPRNYMNLVVKRATMTGFVVLDYKKESPRGTKASTSSTPPSSPSLREPTSARSFSRPRSDRTALRFRREHRSCDDPTYNTEGE